MPGVTPEVTVLCRSARPSGAERALLRAAITSDEEAHRGGFRNAIDADRFLVGRGTLRLEIGRILGIAPRDARLELGEHGKPLVAGGVPHVNVSHSGEVVLIAVCASAPIGIDVEAIEARHVDRATIEHSFSDREIAAYAQLPEDVRLQAFFHTWTSRESVMKVLGAGFSLPRESFDVSVDPRVPPVVLDTRPPVPPGVPLALVPIPVPSGHAAMLAIADARPFRLTMKSA